MLTAQQFIYINIALSLSLSLNLYLSFSSSLDLYIAPCNNIKSVSRLRENFLLDTRKLVETKQICIRKRKLTKRNRNEGNTRWKASGIDWWNTTMTLQMSPRNVWQSLHFRIAAYIHIYLGIYIYILAKLLCMYHWTTFRV